MQRPAITLARTVGASAAQADTFFDYVRVRSAESLYENVPREESRTDWVNELQARLTGYRVAYDYGDQIYATPMREGLSPYPQVRVSVDLVGTVFR